MIKQILIILACGLLIGFMAGKNSVKVEPIKDYVRCFEHNDVAACCSIGKDISQLASFNCETAMSRDAVLPQKIERYLNEHKKDFTHFD
ncbi:MAG: hypothetical protein RLZZ203_2290 [Cyanobacteriota bacterium]|jgi:hypothetical protein